MQTLNYSLRLLINLQFNTIIKFLNLFYFINIAMKENRFKQFSLPFLRCLTNPIEEVSVIGYIFNELFKLNITLYAVKPSIYNNYASNNLIFYL